MNDSPMRMLRKALGMTQIQTAYALGLSQGAVSKIERKPERLRLTLLQTLVEAQGGRLRLLVVKDGEEIDITALFAI